MDGGLPMLNSLLQHTLRSLCSCSESSSTSSKWVYAVFWRILPRNYPPPKWDYGGGILDRSKGNRRNWILVWEDGFCDFYECERARDGYSKGRFGAEVFFKMSHEVYNYGEGLVGKVAADNSHKWVFRETQNGNDSNFISSWSGTMEPQPKQWDAQFNSGIQTIAIISVREGIVQLGSLDKILEDLNLVISIQRKFSYLQSIPGVLGMQRPYLPIQKYPDSSKQNTQMIETKQTALLVDEKHLGISGKRCYGERLEEFPIKSINLGWNSPQTSIGGPVWSNPPLLPFMSRSLGALLSKLPSVVPPHNAMNATDRTPDNSTTIQRTVINEGGLGEISETKVETPLLDLSKEEKPRTQNLKSSWEDQEERCIFHTQQEDGLSSIN
ncbi:uncharacterized protein LOC122660968 [Telopea speciosissima]|uniref:uncharacterized protein LOC122660968 n=1 Tax=Telopea speciosissima TaxID=54955 RepID=UPI001CC3FE8A|nr:uncharacterized protein LOC122660968 [Telopea speciosissima]